MLGNRDAIATIAVKDPEAAKRLYEGVRQRGTELRGP